MKLKKGSR